MSTESRIVKIFGVVLGSLIFVNLGTPGVHAQRRDAPIGTISPVSSPDDVANAVADKLDLTEAQRRQIREIAAAEKPVIAPIVAQMKAAQAPLQATLQRGIFDPAQAQKIAQEQSVSITSLVVEAELVKPRVLAVLTPGQQQQARQVWDDRMTQVEERFTHPSPLPDRFITLVRRRLDLSDDQVTTIRQAVSSGKSAAAPVVTSLFTHLRALQTLDVPADESVIRRIAQQSEPDEAALLVQCAQTQAAIFAALTPAQTAQVAQLRTQIQERRPTSFGRL